MSTRNISAFALIIGAAVVIGGMGLASAHGMGGMWRGGPFFEQKTGMLSDILGISAEELQDSRENGQSLPELLEKKGVTLEQFHEKVTAAEQERLSQLVSDGTITQQQADARIEHMQKMHERMESGETFDKPFGPMGLLSEQFGITADEFKAARENGTSLHDMLAAKGSTDEQFHAAMMTTEKERLQQLVQEGAITQEQADERIQRMEEMHQKIESGEISPEPFGMWHHGHRWLQ